MDIELVKSMIEHVGEGIACDDDWMPTLIFEAKGHCTVLGMPIPIDSSQDADIAAAIIRLTLKTAQAETAVWITTAWTVEVKADTADQEEAFALSREHRLNERPDKKEVVVAVIGKRGGKCNLLCGRVIRSAEHPRVEWMPSYGDGDYSGRFPDAVMEGVNA